MEVHIDDNDDVDDDDDNNVDDDNDDKNNFQHFFFKKKIFLTNIFFQHFFFNKKFCTKIFFLHFFTKNFNFKIIQLLINWVSAAVTNCHQLWGLGVCYPMELATASLACFIFLLNQTR